MDNIGPLPLFQVHILYMYMYHNITYYYPIIYITIKYNYNVDILSPLCTFQLTHH